MTTSTVDFSPTFAELLSRRGLTRASEVESFLNPQLTQLADPYQMKGMDQAVSRIRRAAQNGEKVLIHGDYDVDGISAAGILARTLQILKVPYIVFLPHRTEDGYGVCSRAIEEACQKGASLVVTVDCGISARLEIQIARSLGLDVMVIDHHQLPPEGDLPPASVILNPLQKDCEYPFKDLSAAGLAFKLSQALIGDKAFDFLDLVTLSTVGDVAPLVGENRILVKFGLELLSKRLNCGVRALAQVASLRTNEMNVGHIGFIIVPRINAAGRMSSPQIAFQLLITDSPKEAASLANVLNEENRTRQKEEQQVLKEAIREVEKTINFNRDRIIIVGREGWHPGVIGIVASRLVEKYYRPTFVISWEGQEGKGSGRSIKGFHLFRALENCREYLEEFGGHEQAAGLKMSQKGLEAFRKQINEYAYDQYDSEIFTRKVDYDLELQLHDLRAGFLQELKLLEPHGVGNRKPAFLTRGLLLKGRPQRVSSQILRFWVSDGFVTSEAQLTGRFLDAVVPKLGQSATVDLVYSPKIRSWNGMESLILDVKELRPVF